MRCPLDGQGEQAGVGAWSSGVCHQADGGLGVSGEGDEGLRTEPWVIRVLSGKGGRASREAEGLPEREGGGHWERRARLPSGGWCGQVLRRVQRGLAGGLGAGSSQTTAWRSSRGLFQPGDRLACRLGCTFLLSWLWLCPCPGLRPLLLQKPQSSRGLPPASPARAWAVI